ncbi:hypothetical protein GCM10027440_18990 [Nocardiopsis coralliicola]
MRFRPEPAQKARRPQPGAIRARVLLRWPAGQRGRGGPGPSGAAAGTSGGGSRSRVAGTPRSDRGRLPSGAVRRGSVGGMFPPVPAVFECRPGKNLTDGVI